MKKLLYIGLLFSFPCHVQAATTLSFDEFEIPGGGSSFIIGDYIKDGVRVAIPGGDPAGLSFTSHQQDRFSYAGSAALVGPRNTSVSLVAGTAFTAESIDLSFVYPEDTVAPNTPDPHFITFTGHYESGATTEQQFYLHHFGFQEYEFNDFFENIVELTWTRPINQGHQFDNITLSFQEGGTVPEPAVSLLGGLASVVAILRRKRKNA